MTRPCRALAALLLLTLVPAALTGCRDMALESDVAEARQAVRAGELTRAEKLLERYLRTAQDKEERWVAWNMLLDVTAQSTPDSPWIVDYLETMLLEFEDSGERVHDILWRLATAHEARGRLGLAADAWTRLINEPGLSDDDKAGLLKRLARLHMRQRRFEEAGEALRACTALPGAGPARQADCLYDLADMAAGQDQFDTALTLARQVMELDGAPAELRARAGFILADIAEQRGRLDEAQALFASIRDTYPNELVIDARLANLKKPPRSKGASPATPPPGPTRK